MKNKFAIIGLVSATLLLISCSPDDFQEEDQQVQQVNVEFGEDENRSIQNDPFYPEVEDDGDGNPLNPKDKG